MICNTAGFAFLFWQGEKLVQEVCLKTWGSDNQESSGYEC